jgi:tetratricopeptide (TPR) repeat protein
MFHYRNFSRRLSAVTPLVLALAIAAGCSTDPVARKQKFLESGARYFQQKEYRHAIIEYRNAVAIDARFGPARAGLADSYAQVGDRANAVQEYVRAADLLPDDADLQLRAGGYLLAAGNADQALVRAERVLKLRPDSVDAHILHGNALAGLSSFDKALESIEQAIRLDPTKGTTFTQKGFIELARGRPERAEEAFKLAVTLAPRSVEAQLALGNYYWTAGRQADTERAFRAALEIDPNHEVANRAMAVLAMATGRADQAEQYLRRVADHTKDINALYALTDYYLLTGRTGDAIARLEPLTAAGAKAPGAAPRLARAHAVAGARSKARAIVDEILRETPRDIEAQLLKGQLLLDEGRRDEALAVMRTAVNSDPGSVEAHYALGKLYAARGDVTAAETAFREVLRLNPRVTVAQVELSRMLLSAGKNEASISTAEEATQSAPNDVGARLTLIRSLLSAKELARAEREIAIVQTALPQLAEIHAQRGVLALHRNDPAGARAAFERARTLKPDLLEAVAGLVLLDIGAKNFAGAKARLEPFVTATPLQPQWLILAAQTYASMQDFASSERLLKQAIELEPTLLPAYSMLGQLYLGQKKLDEARKEFEALAARQTKPVAALTMSAIILQQQGNLSLAAKRFEEVLAIDPRSPVAANNLAWIYSDSSQNLDAALQLALTATTASPDVAEFMDTLGWVYYKKNLPQLAIPQFARSAEKAPGNPVYHHHLGLAHMQNGDSESGRASLQRALAARPDPATASEIQRLLGQDRPTAVAR